MRQFKNDNKNIKEYQYIDSATVKDMSAYFLKDVDFTTFILTLIKILSRT